MGEPSATVDYYNQYQFDDLLARENDLYANTKYEIILGYLAGTRGLRILNVGCGSGELSFMLAAAGHRVFGIDPAAEYIDVARRKAERLPHLRCEFAVSTIEDFQSDSRYDCVIATDVLEHILHDDLAFTAMVRLIDPGGLVILTIPAGQWLFGYHDESLGHFRRYSLRDVRMLVRAHCRVDRLRYFGFSLIPVCLLYSRLLRKPYPVAAVGDKAQNPLVARATRLLLQLDKRVSAPLGTSVIFKGTRL